MNPKQTPEQEALDQQRVYDNAMAVQQMKARRNADAYQQLQRETEASQGRYQANPVLQQYLQSNPDVFRAATDAAIQSGVPKQGSRFTGGISNEYQNILDDFARQHYIDFGRKEGRGIASLPTVGRGELDKSVLNFTPKEYTMQNYGYVPNSFDAEFYATSNPDVRQALGTSPFDLYQHFIDHGKAEGRQARNPLGAQQFAEGGQVMGGMQPMTPASENSGIASGMMPEPPPPEGMQAMQQMAGQMEQVYRGLDSAEDIEDVINAMRGDDLPLSERYSELAELVGPADAKKTPESVLTVLQPVFQTLETVPDGGIAEAPMGGVEGSEGNFSQPSATEPSDQAEAVLAMSRGEMPVGMALGGMPMPFAQNYGFPSQRAQDITAATLQQNPNAPGLLSQLQGGRTLSPIALPKYPKIDMDEIKSTVKGYRGLLDNLDLQKAETDPTKTFETIEALRSKYAPETETAEEILARRKEFMGDTDTDDTAIQGYLALADAGSRLASTPGSLLTGLTQAAGPLAANLSKIQAKKSEQEREAKGAAFDLSETQKEKLRAFGETTANKSIEEFLANEKINAKQANNAIIGLVGPALAAAGKERDAQIKALNVQYTADVSNNTLSDQVFYARKNSKTGEVETLVFYDKAEKYVDPKTGKFVDGAPPEDYRPVKTPDIDDLIAGPNSGALKDMLKNAKPKPLQILKRDANNVPTGFERVEGFFALGRDYIPNARGGFTALNPGEYFRDDGKSIYEVKNEQGVRFKIVRNPSDNSIISRTPIDSRSPNAYGAATGANSPYGKYTVTEENKAKLENLYGKSLTVGDNVELGSPTIYRVTPSATFDKNQDKQYILPEKFRNELQEKTGFRGELIREINDKLLNEDFLKTFGIKGGMTSFISGNVAGLFGDTAFARALTDVNSEEYRTTSQLLSRLVKRSLALSSRFPVRELEQLQQLLPEAGEIFTQPTAVLKRIQTFMAANTNEQLTDLHLLNPVDNPSSRVYQIQSGSKEDPLRFDEVITTTNSEGEQMRYLPAFNFAKRLAESGRDLQNQFAIMTVKQAEALGLPENVWKRKQANPQELITVKLKTIRQNGRTTISGSSTTNLTRKQRRNR